MLGEDALRAQYERAIERNAARLAVLDALPGEDPYEDGQVLRISRAFGSSKVYSYAALRADGRWWLTGERHVRYGIEGTVRPSGLIGPGIAWVTFREWLVDNGDPRQLEITELNPGRQVV